MSERLTREDCIQVEMDSGGCVIDVRVNVPVKLLREGAVLPAYATGGAAGFDLVSADDDVWIEPGRWRLVGTGLAVAVPRGWELQVRPRSGLAAKAGLTVLNAPGTIDSDYRGEVKVCLVNMGRATVHVPRGMRMAQGVLCPVDRAAWRVVDDLEATARGAGGFGSTGT